jgi:methylmalonyl-CoA mutase N-terminal domain/subunit
MVGVNRFTEEGEPDVDILKIDDAAERLQKGRMAKMRASRDEKVVEARLAVLHAAAAADQNVIPAMLDCARAYCTLFEIRHTLEGVWGAYREPVFF